MVSIYRSLLQKMFEISHGNESGGGGGTKINSYIKQDLMMNVYILENRDILSRLDFSLRITFSAKREKEMHY